MGASRRVIGQALSRRDGAARVSGEARYTADLDFPDALYARVLRSPYAHAAIKAIDTTEAERMPGVRAVLHFGNAKVKWASGDMTGRRHIFNNPARYVGDAVAAVAADDRRIAEEALAAIRVDYEPLDFVLDEEEALRQGKVFGKPVVHARGNLQAGFAQADVIYEGRFTSVHHNNAQLEPRIAIAKWEAGDGRDGVDADQLTQLTVWTPTQGISNCRIQIAADLGIPLESVRVIVHYMGSGFGNKNQDHDFELMAAVLAREARRTVRLEYTRREDFTTVHGRWPTTQDYRAGVTRDGVLTALTMRGVSGMGPYHKGSGTISGRGLYAIPNIRTELNLAATNVTTSANYRGPSEPQGVFGMESVIDELAYRIGMNPLDFRLKNFSRDSDGKPFTSCGLETCILSGAEKINWRAGWTHPTAKRGRVRQGLGMGIGRFSSLLGMSKATLRVKRDGSVQLCVAVTDIGTGAKTILAQVAAEVLCLHADEIEIVYGDTRDTPYSIGESGSRTTTQVGAAVVEAAHAVLDQMSPHAARRLGAAQVRYENGNFVAVAADGDGTLSTPGGAVKRLSFREAAAAAPEDLAFTASPNPVLTNAARASFTAHFAAVEVDTLTGEVRVTRYVAMQDCGTVINPLTAASQVKGAALQGISIALHERLTWDRNTGIPLNAGYHGAKIITHADAPEIEVGFIETMDAYGPFGAKTLGEVGIIPSVAAVANAIYNAIGVRYHAMPMTRDQIIEGLQQMTPPEAQANVHSHA